MDLVSVLGWLLVVAGVAFYLGASLPEASASTNHDKEPREKAQ